MQKQSEEFKKKIAEADERIFKKIKKAMIKLQKDKKLKEEMEKSIKEKLG